MFSKIQGQAREEKNGINYFQTPRQKKKWHNSHNNGIMAQ